MWAQQQRKVKLRLPFLHLKCDFHDGIQSIDLLLVVIARRIEAQTVEPRAKSIVARKQLGTAALSVGARGT
jgi:hypothetical protein